MIPVDLFNRKKTSLDYKIIKFINDNLKAIVEVYIDFLNDSIDVSETLMEILPRDYVLRKPEECRRLVDELYEIICSPVLRDYIKPKYEYLLFYILYRWKELCDDGLQDLYLPVKLSDDVSAAA